MTITSKRSLIALLLSLVLVISLFTVGISAASTAESGSEAVTETESAGKEETTKKEDESKKEETSKKTETPKEETTEKVDESVLKTKNSLIINGIISGVLVIIAVILAIKFRKKLGDFLRSVKSEFKKITWSSKENTRKSFLVVVVVAVVVALVLWAIDFAFHTGISELTKLFHK